MGRRFLLAFAVVLAASGLAAAAAFAGAGGAGTVSLTEHFSGVIDQETTTNPCTGEPGVFTLTATNAVSHLTYNANGFWSTFTAEGTATFAPTDTSQPVVSGHFTAWDDENGNLKNGTSTGTFTVHIDGVKMHETFHDSVSATGLSISFDKMWFSCS